MSGTWQRFNSWSTEIPRAPLDDDTREARELPKTLRPVPGNDVVQRPVFDPALKQYPNAYRASDPSFPDPAREKAWRTARRLALDLVMAAVSDSPWAESLVLRGSMLMSAWFGEAAREPGDLDFVVVPHTWRKEDPRTGRMFEEIAVAAEVLATERGTRVTFSSGDAVVEDIWTYERVPGRRMVLPWSAPGLPGGHVQLDFVFNERLPEPPELVELPGGAIVLAATARLSLAWKLMWIINDTYAQGKDLYDATLLAERHPLPFALLHEVFRLSGEWPASNREHVVWSDLVQGVRHVEWHHFIKDYPQFEDDEREFAERLLRAVAPAFEGTREE